MSGEAALSSNARRSIGSIRLDHLQLLGPLCLAFIACLCPVDVVTEACFGIFIFCFLILPPSLRKSSGSQTLRSSRERLSLKAPQRREPRNETFTAFKRGNVTFVSEDFEGQVAELLHQIDINVAMSEKLSDLKKSLSSIFKMSFSKSDVHVFAVANPGSARAFGTAIPEVAVLLTVPPHEMARMPMMPGKDKQRLSACLRACLAILVKQGFKFRRSDFSCDNPKVIFLAEAYQFSMDFFVNTREPFKFHSLLEYVAETDPSAKDLVLLVRHWARERGLALVATGYISLHAWMVLALFYLQVAPQANEHSSRLAALGQYLQGASQRASPEVVTLGEGASRESSCAALFRGFMSFYAKEFDWSNEVVSLRLGTRRTRTFRVGQWTRIENPFDASVDLAASFTIDTLERVREEFDRAHKLLEQKGSLEEIVAAWKKAEVS